jgi:hypothetical protein
MKIIKKYLKITSVAATVFLVVFILSGCQNNNSYPQDGILSVNQIPKNNSCGTGYYKNVDGICVHSPNKTSCEGATAICRDGACSFSQHRQGTCSGHGGVAQWL